QSDHNGRLCLGLVDSRPEAKFRGPTSLEFEHVRTALYHCNARTKIVILDCCFAGLAVQPHAALGVRDVADRARCDGAYTMAASAEYDLARYEEGATGRPQTYFTRYLADVVEQGIGGHGEALTLQVLFHETSSRMRASRLSPPTQANRDNASMFPFSRNPAAVDTADLPPGLVEALRNPLPDVRGAVVLSLRDLANSGDPRQAEAAGNALRHLAEHDPDTGIRRRVGRALSELADTPTPSGPTRGRPLRLWAGRSAPQRAVIVLVVVALVAALTADAFTVLKPGESAANIPLPDRRPTGSDQQQVETLVKPSPLPADFSLPRDRGEPDAKYEQKITCVTSLTGPIPVQEPWGQARLDLRKAHGYATGAGQQVAVIDTGVNRHNFLGTRVTGGGDYVKPNSDGLEDCDGHGTEVAGIIAASPPYGSTEFIGVAPQAKILSIRQSTAAYTTKVDGAERAAGTLDTLAQAVINAANKNATVINITVNNCRTAGLGPINDAEQGLQAALRYAVEVKKAVVVVPAGDCQPQNGSDINHPNVISIPAWFSDYVISVASVKQDGRPTDSSLHGPWVSVAAPGTDIISLDPGNPTRLTERFISTEGKESRITGTAFASAYVAGLAALVREYRPQLTPKQVMNRIKYTANHPSAVDGWNDEVGFGLINPVAALTAQVPGE
ncbi:MAG TPA: type VII secretion-associated serine protease mycosin, partial [Actinophytocola sp.]|uniref:type VII secretion-associated serine protease mycosin n=1 Tax=Actinophytocola sp. TaxID=1872138 RepID=UPI002DFF7F32|nr:type VII secretion-associated serine protease mycosin [Actinophytocola sp.]